MTFFGSSRQTLLKVNLTILAIFAACTAPDIPPSVDVIHSALTTGPVFAMDCEGDIDDVGGASTRWGGSGPGSFAPGVGGGQACEFTGSNCIETGTIAVTGDFTASMWVKRSAAMRMGAITTSPTGLVEASGVMSLTVGDAGRVDDATLWIPTRRWAAGTAVVGDWTHYAVVCAAMEGSGEPLATLYVNGQPVQSGIPTGADFATTGNVIGMARVDVQQWTAPAGTLIDEVKIFDRPLSHDELLAMQSDRPAKSGSAALSFESGTRRMFSDATPVSLGSAWAFSAWYRPTLFVAGNPWSARGDRFVVNGGPDHFGGFNFPALTIAFEGDASEFGPVLKTQAGCNAYPGVGYQQQHTKLGAPSNLGVWAHWVVSFDGGEVKAYRDGMLVSETTHGHTSIPDCVGGNHYGLYSANGGSFDAVAVYTHAVSSTTATALYDLGPDNPASVTAAPLFFPMYDDGAYPIVTNHGTIAPLGSMYEGHIPPRDGYPRHTRSSMEIVP